MALPPEREQKTMENTLILLQQEFSDLEIRSQGISTMIEICKVELLRNTKMLKKSMERNIEVRVHWEWVTSHCNWLKTEFSSYGPELQKYMESLIREKGLLRAISQQDNQSKEAKLMTDLKDLYKKSLDLSSNLIQAELDEEWLSSKNRLLEAAHKRLLASVERFEGENSNISLPTNPESEEDAQSHSGKAKDSRARTPPFSPESGMRKKCK